MNKKRNFVVLFHEMPEKSARSHHWDLMLESSGHLETWSLPKLPAAETILQATKLAPHRVDYLAYEGPLTNDRGRVTRVMSGQFAGEMFPDNSPQEFDLKLWLDDREFNVHFTQIDGDSWEVRFSSNG